MNQLLVGVGQRRRKLCRKGGSQRKVLILEEGRVAVDQLTVGAGERKRK